MAGSAESAVPAKDRMCDEGRGSWVRELADGAGTDLVWLACGEFMCGALDTVIVSSTVLRLQVTVSDVEPYLEHEHVGNVIVMIDVPDTAMPSSNWHKSRM